MTPPSLLDLQFAVKRALLQHTDTQACAAAAAASVVPAAMVNVHRNTLIGNLAGALRLSFPAVQRLVGAEFFEGAARIFAREQLPRCADLNAYGAGFPRFLQGFQPAAALAYLPDVARLEWAVNRALHAPDAPALEMSRLAAVAERDHDRLRFVPHPSISMLRSAFPVDAIWDAVLRQDDAAMAAIDPSGPPVYLMVERVAEDVDVQRCECSEWGFAAALLEGQPLGAALANVAVRDAPALLAGHLSAGRCIGFHLDAA